MLQRLFIWMFSNRFPQSGRLCMTSRTCICCKCKQLPHMLARLICKVFHSECIKSYWYWPESPLAASRVILDSVILGWVRATWNLGVRVAWKRVVDRVSNSLPSRVILEVEDVSDKRFEYEKCMEQLSWHSEMRVALTRNWQNEAQRPTGGGCYQKFLKQKI